MTAVKLGKKGAPKDITESSSHHRRSRTTMIRSIFSAATIALLAAAFFGVGESSPTGFPRTRLVNRFGSTRSLSFVVNIATYLLLDAFQKSYEVAAVLSLARSSEIPSAHERVYPCLAIRA
jgi:hypothetical protein